MTHLRIASVTPNHFLRYGLKREHVEYELKVLANHIRNQGGTIHKPNSHCLDGKFIITW